MNHYNVLNTIQLFDSVFTNVLLIWSMFYT